MDDSEARAEILVVDDNPNNLGILTNILGTDYDVRVTVNGKLALAAAQSSPPDLILLDIMMPDIDGYEVCQRLKADKQTGDIPVIFISALDASLDKVKAFSVGGVDYIEKPFQVEEVQARVRTHLSIYRLQQNLARKNAELLEQVQQINRLQEITRGFLSGRAWGNILSNQSKAPAIRDDPVHQVLTILVSDIKGYTQLVEQSDPENLLHDLKYYIDLLTSIIYQNGGDVDKFLGDGILALFPSPVSALTAACQIQKGLTYFNQARMARNAPYFPTRIALTTGEILLARIGTFDRQEYAIMGDRVNTAVCLQKQSPIGGLAMDENTLTTLGVIRSLAVCAPSTDERIHEPIYLIPDCSQALSVLQNETQT